MSRTHANLQLAVASAVTRKAEEVPEISAEEILAGLTRELRVVTAAGFGPVYYYHPMSIAEQLDLQSKVDPDGGTTAANLIQTIIALARTKEGSPKFKPEHAAGLLNAPPEGVLKLATAMMGARVSLASVEKK